MITRNSGQICVASSRVYVQEGIYDRFLEEYMRQLKSKSDSVGDPDDPESRIGPLVDKAQFNRVMGIIRAAKEEQQGTLLMGGRAMKEKVITFHRRLFRVS